MVSEPLIVTTAQVSDAAVRELPSLAGRDINFRPMSWDEAAAHPDWHVDQRRTTLPSEPPGPPRADGIFVVARDFLVDYRFADPAYVRAVYDAAAPLDGRDMLLVGRFLWLRFHMGVRVGGVVDEDTHCDGRPVHRFAWYYRTLEGHLERGQMDYELRKYLDTGEVELRIRAYSQRGDIRSPLVRLGFILFGRWKQLRFYDRVMSRMEGLVERHLERAA